jgi:ferrous iron transport protein A
LVPLALLKPGTPAKVIGVRGGHGFNRHLAAMGILPGAEVRLVGGGVSGPVIVEVCGSRVLLGRGVTHRVMVKPVA